jgi:hypothetical protein
MKAILKFFGGDVLRFLFWYKIMGIPGWIPTTIGIALWILYKLLQNPEDKEDSDKEEH